MDRFTFPFSAIIGQEQAKLALIYGAINPKIGGVLLCGQKGCAKSTLVRALASLNGINVVDLPLNITEDMLIGMIDLQEAVRFGRKAFEGGVLQRANGNILYVDEVNLLPDTIVNALLDVMQSGINQMERDGISYTHSSEFLLVGSMNPEESPLRAHFLDRFGLYVEMRGIQSVEQRKEVIKQRMAFEADPAGFIRHYHEQDQQLAERIKTAQERIQNLPISAGAMLLAVELAVTANTAGHRAEIVMIETALAIAAFQGEEAVTEETVKAAAPFVLAHRIREQQSPPVQPQEDSQETEDSQLPLAEKEENETEQMPSAAAQNETAPQNMENSSEKQTEPQETNSEDSIVAGQEVYAVHDLNAAPMDRIRRKGSGRRSKTASGTRRGRYIGFELPKQQLYDIALDATLRTAAIHQITREKDGMAISIHKSDIRVKKRENRIGTTIIFAVDASGSMGAKQRMVATKEAILSLLYDAYQKRDQVGMIAFRKDHAEILLPITRSIDLAQKRLQKLPTGGRTPLAEGLFMAWQMITVQQMKDNDMVPLLVLITDGKANRANHAEDPVGEAMAAAEIIRDQRIPSIVIDTEKGVFPLGIAQHIAENMRAQYYKVDQLRAEVIGEVVRSTQMIH